jgi:hypothetical protein
MWDSFEEQVESRVDILNSEISMEGNDLK